MSPVRGEPVRGEPGQGEPRVRVVGIGMGPAHLTREAEEVLRSADHVIAFRKGADDALLEVRALICAEFDLDLVEIEDPVRDRHDPADYEGVVAQWHDVRAAALARVLGERRGVAVILVWGDPSLYDSTLRLLERVDRDHLPGEKLTWDVFPGIATPQLLAARHRIVLHPVGTPVHITTARRLREDLAAGQRNLCVMLGSVPDLADLPRIADWTIWWGANLGAPSEQLVHGLVGQVHHQLVAAKERARALDGWVMDAYLLQAPAHPTDRPTSPSSPTEQETR